MSFNTLREEVANQFIANWSGDLTQVDYGGNNEFKPSDEVPWVRLSINVLSSINGEVGGDMQRSDGLIAVQCFVPVNTGEKLILEMVDDVVSTFQNKNFGGVKCYATNPVRVGESGNWYQYNASTVFQYDVFS